MKNCWIFLASCLVALFLFSGCKPQQSENKAEETPAAAPVAESPVTQSPVAQSAPVQAPASVSHTGQVMEAMNAGGYTYVQVDTGTEKVWAAAPEFEVKVGQTVTVPPGAPMPNYHSKTLDRDFDLVYFVPAINAGGAAPSASAKRAMPTGHPSLNGGAGKHSVGLDLSGIPRAEGGKTVEEVFAGKAELAGKEIIIRGKVVKYNPQIMGFNWVHIQDGTGQEGSNDLTITTSDTAKAGDTVLVKGNLTLNKDFGGGYTYDVIIEKGQVTVEDAGNGGS